MLHVVIYSICCFIFRILFNIFFLTKGCVFFKNNTYPQFSSSFNISYDLNQFCGLKYSTDFIYIFVNSNWTYIWLFFFNSIFFRLLLVCFLIWI